MRHRSKPDESEGTKLRKESLRSTRGVVSGTRPAHLLRAPGQFRLSEQRPARAGEVAGYEAPHFCYIGV